MRIAKRLLLGLGSIAVVVAIVILASPKTAHALVAALVQVTNTTSNPAITWDADESTRIPYQSRYSFNGVPKGPNIMQVGQFATVPAGYRLVLTNISCELYAESGTPLPFAEITTNFSLNNPFPVVTGVFVGPYDGFGYAIINQNIIRYVAAGDTPEAYVYWDAGTIQENGSDTVVLTGYLENCTVTGCPAPVH